MLPDISYLKATKQLHNCLCVFKRDPQHTRTGSQCLFIIISFNYTFAKSWLTCYNCCNCRISSNHGKEATCCVGWICVEVDYDGSASHCTGGGAIVGTMATVNGVSGGAIIDLHQVPAAIMHIKCFECESDSFPGCWLYSPSLEYYASWGKHGNSRITCS